MLLFYLAWLSYVISNVIAYTNSLFSISNTNNEIIERDCGGVREPPNFSLIIKHKLLHSKEQWVTTPPTNNFTEAYTYSFQTIRTTTRSEKDPLVNYQQIKQKILFGSKTKADVEFYQKKVIKIDDYIDDEMGHYPSGSVMHAELFQNKSAVHLPMPELVHRNHCFLRLTKDYMQTAVDAFSIFLEGSMEDVLRLPSSYVLRSARTIAMMKIAKEKLAASWTVVKGDLETIEIPYQTLETYRPLFKYLSGREMARLNLSDDRILTFIGTHADLDRHQVGVVASKYIGLNDAWTEPRYLNLMNNLLCGVPMTFMRKIPESTYLQLTHQVFYHTRACDPLQRRFYLAMMTKTQALGRSYSWSARDVSRLGLLLSEVDGTDLAAVNPEAMSGITSQVMLEIPPQTLQHVTEMQLRYIAQKPLNILAKKLKIYQEQVRLSSASNNHSEALQVILLGVIAIGIITICK